MSVVQAMVLAPICSNAACVAKEHARFRSKGKRILWMSRHILHGCPCARRALPSCIPGNTMSLWLDEIPAAAPPVGARQRGKRDLLCLHGRFECGFQYENAGIRPPSPNYMGQRKILV